MTLKDLKIEESAVITEVGGEGALRQQFLDKGIIPGAVITLKKFAPMGDPVQFLIQGYELTLRLEDAGKIYVSRDIPAKKNEEDASSQSDDDCRKKRRSTEFSLHTKHDHPGLGEGGRFHNKEDEHPLPEGTTLTFALVGNQNCGKTTLFNQLTGSNEHVGNFPGVTVEKRSVPLKNRSGAVVTDLPGLYSLTPFSDDELVSLHYLLREKPNCIINVVDATNIERNLLLTMQLLELNIPMVLALNMMDELRGNGGHVRINELEEMLGIPVIPIAAAKNEGIEELLDHALHIAKYQELPLIQDFCDKNSHGGAVHRCLHGIMHLIEDHAAAADLPIRFAAGKIVEGEPRTIAALKLETNELEMLEHIIGQMETERGLDRAAAMADMRFSFITKLCAKTVVKPSESKEHKRSMAIDRFLTGKYTGIPAFAVIMVLIFYLTFNVIGAFLQEYVELGIEYITELVDNSMTAAGVNEGLQSLVVDGIMNGVGSVISFIPIVVVLFFFLSILEDSGYAARVAFVMDKLLRKMGLSGRSTVPMLIGFGCSVPAIMACRTLPSERDRKMTIMLTPYMSCTAKLPIYAYFTAAFFPGHGGLVMAGLYFFGIFAGIISSLLMKKTLFKGEAVPFVMELPNYRIPLAKSVLHIMWEMAWDFLRKAFTIIFLGTIVIWLLQTFDFGMHIVTNSHDSMLAVIAGIIAPIFAPLGFGDWRISTALITGILAKESVVSTLAVLFGSAEALQSVLTASSALSLLIFCLLYVQCIASIAAIKRELGAKWMVTIIISQCAIAWVWAFIIRLIGLALGFG